MIELAVTHPDMHLPCSALDYSQCGGSRPFLSLTPFFFFHSNFKIDNPTGLLNATQKKIKKTNKGAEGREEEGERNKPEVCSGDKGKAADTHVDNTIAQNKNM